MGLFTCSRATDRFFASIGSITAHLVHTHICNGVKCGTCPSKLHKALALLELTHMDHMKVAVAGAEGWQVRGVGVGSAG